MTPKAAGQTETPEETEADEGAAWTGQMLAALRRAAIGAVSYIPDEGAGRLISALESDPDVVVIPVTREGEAVGVLTGAWLGQRRGALLMQASGVGNCINALASVNVACGLPLLLIIGERGGLSEFNPCQTPGGRAVPVLLGAIGIQTFRIDDPRRIADVVEGAATLAFSTAQPVGIILGTHMQKGKHP